MTESLNGLRFDIYERVHLPEEANAIEELEEIELVPHIQAIPSGNQVLLKGHLLLTGSYRSLDERSDRSQLEHWIPVEISLPPSRVERLEELSVEIDNFDVDLLSSRSLNVTGVLGLRGVQIASQSAQAPVWQEDGFTVVHQAPQEPAQEPSQRAGQAEIRPEQESYSPSRAEYGYLASYEPTSEARPPQPSAYPQQAAPADQTAPQQAVPPWQSFPPSHVPPSYAADSPLPAFPAAEQQAAELRQSGETSELSEPSPLEAAEAQPARSPYRPSEQGGIPEQQAVPEFNLLNADYGDDSWGDVTVEQLEVSREQPSLEEPYTPAADKTELKIGFGTKQASDPPAVALTSGVGLLSQLGDKGARREEELQAAEDGLSEAGASNVANRDTSGDEIDWARLFLSKEEGEQSFRKVKLCIVQREDTLEAIATRYNVQSRELQLYNRLADPHVSEGQIIYIP